ncbi:dTDP-4-dehydrorhamnose 3,5-epimerase [Maricaulis parjimensis]|uniref:dTDP-4-dehydrorhamnose 3,5-epimerase n=1 Tax=Maricaulis parjimensis TaxID=144023 RepID=UPI001939B926|nr:dTDP-4-dehydrorhamnose 3,5-epimerase [Maricaulis parjimensis]
MDVQQLAIPGVVVLTPRRFGDDRGFFTEAYNDRTFTEAGIGTVFVQDNHSFSKAKGTVRGMHYQAPPFAQAKLVRAITGRVLDVVVDIRKGSPTFGRSASAELTSEGGEQIFVPPGFLHGFLTLEANTHIVYKVDNYYSSKADGAVRFDDPALGIDWGYDVSAAVLSEKDANAVSWQDFQSPFDYVGSTKA